MDQKTSTAEDQFFQRVGQLVGEADWTGLEALCESHLQTSPNCSEAFFLLALAAFVRDDFAAAMAYGRQAVDISPNIAEYADFLAVIYGMAGDIHNATFHAKLASAGVSSETLAAWLPPSLPRFTDAFLDIEERPFFSRATAASAQNDWATAEHWYRQHLAFNPRDALAHASLGKALMIQGLNVAAMETLRAARHVLPDDAKIAQLLATALCAVGQFAEGQSVDRRAIAAAPDDLGIHAGAIVNLAADPDASPADIAAMSTQWGQRFGVDPELVFPAGPATAKERLTVGYVVGAMDRSGPARALSKILACHDSKAFRVVGFGSGSLSDRFNVVFQKCFGSWVDTRETDPLTFASMVSAEEVDILVDVSGLTTPTLLTAFGARMAPVQLAWDGCPYGAGLAALDGLLTDGFLDPDGVDAVPIAQKRLRLNNGAILADLPANVGQPMAERGEGEAVFAADVTVGELDPSTVEMWSRVLAAMPNSQLILYDRGFRNEFALPRLIGLFGNFGLAHRVDIVSEVGLSEFLGLADVFLVPRQADRTTAVLMALGAGLPVVAPQGVGRHRRAVGSLLHHVGLGDEMIASSPEAYVELAGGWMTDAGRRQAFRDGVAARLAAGPLFDAAARAADLEDTYRKLWAAVALEGAVQQ